jgi:transposase-like protein
VFSWVPQPVQDLQPAVTCQSCQRNFQVHNSVSALSYATSGHGISATSGPLLLMQVQRRSAT